MKGRTPPSDTSMKGLITARTSPFVGGIPPQPSGLDRDGHCEWKRLVKQLSDKGVLSVADGPILQITCEAYSHLMQSIRAAGNGGRTSQDGAKIRMNLEGQIMADNLNVYRRCIEECGVPPAKHLQLRCLTSRDHKRNTMRPLSMGGEQ